MTEEEKIKEKLAGLPVSGYTAQPQSNVNKVNGHKRSEELLLSMMDVYRNDTSIDQRWLAIARTQMEQAFMALNRSVFKPERVKL